jgi:fatty-acid desaturase
MMKKITFHTKLMTLLFLHFLLVIYALLNEWNWMWLLIAWLVSKLFNALGNEAGLHRLWTHKSYKTSRQKEFLLHLFSVPLLYGSSITYAGIHRQHHAYADTEKDPHIRPWWKTFFYVRNKKYSIENKFVSDLIKDPWHKWVHKNYFKINFGLLFLSLIFFGVILTGWFLSFIIVYNFIAAGLVNTLGHIPKFGQQPFNNGDDSTNNKFLQWLTWNEGLHNNHHYAPGSYTYVMRKGEIDFPAFLIKKFLMKHE